MKTTRKPLDARRHANFLNNKSSSFLAPSVVCLASSVYFVQGAISLSAIAFPLLLRGKGWSISEIAAFAFWTGLPWTLKIIYGALSDGVPLGGYRRKSYVAISSLLSMVAWLGVAFFHDVRLFLYGFSFAANLGFAVTDVVTDALVVEHSTETSSQVYQSLSWGFRSLGAVLGGVSGGWLAQHVPPVWIFSLTACLPLMTFVVGFFIQESPQREKGGLHFIRPLWQAVQSLCKGDLLWFSALLLVGSCSAAFNTPFFFFLKESLGFSETFLGTLSSVAWLGAIGGCFFYARWLRRISLKTMLYGSIGLNVVSILSTYFIKNPLSAATLSFAGGIIGYLSFLPLIATAAILSRQKGIEGSLFALLMSVNNLGQLLSTYVGGKLFDIMGLHRLIFLSAVIGLSGVIFVGRMKIR